MESTRLVRELSMRGGVARRLHLPVSKSELDHAVAHGVVRRLSRGVYALPDADAALQCARVASGARSHRTAASAHGFAVLTPPEQPEIVVPRGRAVPQDVRRRTTVRVRLLSRSEQSDALTSPLSTVIACLRDLGGVEGLVVADSAVRSGQVTGEEIRAALQREHGQGVRAARRLAEEIDPGAESALETALRWVARDVPGVHLRTQMDVRGDGWKARVDLGDPDLGLIAEADSFAWHGSRTALARDAKRYDQLVAAGWRVLRFTYEAVLFESVWVRRQLAEAVAVQQAMCAAGVRPWRHQPWWADAAA